MNEENSLKSHHEGSDNSPSKDQEDQQLPELVEERSSDEEESESVSDKEQSHRDSGRQKSHEDLDPNGQQPADEPKQAEGLPVGENEESKGVVDQEEARDVRKSEPFIDMPPSPIEIEDQLQNESQPERMGPHNQGQEKENPVSPVSEEAYTLDIVAPVTLKKLLASHDMD